MIIDANLLEGVKLGIAIEFIIAMPIAWIIGVATYRKGVEDGKDA